MQTDNKIVIPELSLNSKFFVLIYILPQMLLLAINLFSGWLIIDEMDQQQLTQGSMILGLQVIVLSLNFLCFFILINKDIRFKWILNVFFLIIHMTYLWYYSFHADDFIPANIQNWILNSSELFMAQYALIMPACFFSLLSLACMNFGMSRSKDIGITVALMILMPAFWYLIAVGMDSLFSSSNSLPIVIIICITVSTTVVMIGALLRLFTYLYLWTSSKDKVGYQFTAILLGLIAPLAGLLLNHSMPFPGDFQSASIYIFTIVNGFVLLIPVDKHYNTTVILFLRAMVFPFTLYFFLVFLPFLPLSFFAILAFGGGFLMLTPVALFAFQTKVNYEEIKIAIEKLGKKNAIGIFLLGFLCIPCYYTFSAFSDKAAINRSLNLVYSPNFTTEESIADDAERVSKILLKLRDMKAGAQIPYLSTVYNSIVFNGMVLPDKKMKQMYELLNGEKMPTAKNISNEIFIGSRRSRNWRPAIVKPNRDIEVKEVSVTDTLSDDLYVKTIRIRLKNNKPDTHSEYVTQFNLPEGVLITGMKLKIEGEFVPARVFDRKTAIWIFEKIKEVRRDPALLIYLSPTEVELRVYPFPANGEREVEVEFTVPKFMQTSSVIAGKQISFGGNSDPHIAVFKNKVYVPQNIQAEPIIRKSYLHFILDFSKGKEEDSKHYGKRMVELADKFKVSQCRITVGNIDSKTLSNSYIDIENKDNLQERINEADLPFRGTFWLEKCLKKELLNLRVKQDNFLTTPIFVIISDNDFKMIPQIKYYSHLYPDLNTVYFAGTDTGIKSYHFKKGVIESGLKENELKPVYLLKNQKQILAVSSEVSSLLAFEKPVKELYFYSSNEKKFKTLNDPIINGDVDLFSAGMDLWFMCKETFLHPHKKRGMMKELLQRSKDLSLMIPTTSFIVVESSVQWKMLTLKEKQKMNAHEALEFEQELESSEPFLLLILIIFFYIVYKKKRTVS
jgi:hypothetical protein